MKQNHVLFGNDRAIYFALPILLSVPVLFINLGLLPLKGDESIRALVSLEMILSGDYVAPTLNGELYFNKPPLYNWILAFFFRFFDSNSDFVIRLPSILFLVVFCISIYMWVKKMLGKMAALTAALMFLTCGRILFYDSMIGLIDITYSWLIFMNFMVIWHYSGKRQFGRLFIFSYLITGIVFLMKGLPSLAFQAITLMTVFTFNNDFRRLFSWRHFAGIFIFICIAGSYYYLYFTRYPESLAILVTRLFTESADKTAAGLPVAKTVAHIFTFPFELLYHFAPWTFLVVFVFNRGIFSRAMKNKFIFFCFLVFSANIVIYWMSPLTYMRYLLMLFPFIFIVFLYLAKYHAVLDTPACRVLKQVLFLGSTALVFADGLVPLVFALKIPVSHVYLKSMAVLLAGISIFYVYNSTRQQGLLVYLAMVMLLTRISFNLFILPYRQSQSWTELCRGDAVNLARQTLGEELYLLTDTITIPNAFYITRERQEILRFRDHPEDGKYYIVDDTTLYGGTFKKEYTMRIPFNFSSFYAGKFKFENEKNIGSNMRVQ